MTEKQKPDQTEKLTQDEWERMVFSRGYFYFKAKEVLSGPVDEKLWPFPEFKQVSKD